MIDALTYKSVTGQSISLNTDTLPLRHFEPEIPVRQTRRTKMQRHGTWPTFTYLDGMLLHLEGDILHNTSTDYNNTRLNLLDVLIPFDFVGPVTSRKMGTVYLTLTGKGRVETDVCLDGYPEIPMQALYPGTSPFTFTWFSFNPYFTDLNGRPVMI